MHELGIVFHVIKRIEEVGQQNHLTQVQSVTLEIGQVSGIVGDYLDDCWKWAVNRSDLMRGAALHVEPISAITHCDGCGKDYGTVEYGRICPYCSSEKTWLLQGNEMNIKEIEAC